MKLFTSAAALAAACLAASPAFAQAEDFSGPRVEVRASWDNLKVGADYPDRDDTDEQLSSSPSDDGVAWGAELGYDAALGESLIVGAYAGIDTSKVEICREIFGDDQGCADTGRGFTAGVRAGYALGPGAMIYVKGGWSNTRMRLGYVDFEEAEDDDDYEPFAYRATRNGWHAGAGIEVPFAGGLYGRAEYVYTDYGTETFTLPDDDDLSASVRMKRHQAVVGLGFRF